MHVNGVLQDGTLYIDLISEVANDLGDMYFAALNPRLPPPPLSRLVIISNNAHSWTIGLKMCTVVEVCIQDREVQHSAVYGSTDQPQAVRPSAPPCALACCRLHNFQPFFETDVSHSRFVQPFHGYGFDVSHSRFVQPLFRGTHVIHLHFCSDIHHLLFCSAIS